MLELAHFLCDWTNPVVTVLLACICLLVRLPSRSGLGRLGFSTLSVLATTAVAEAAKRFQVWPGHPLFPSGHETYAAAAATTAIYWGGPRAAPIALLVAAQGWALVAAGFHDPIDIGGALVLGTVIPLTILRATRGRRVPNGVSWCLSLW